MMLKVPPLHFWYLETVESLNNSISSVCSGVFFFSWRFSLETPEAAKRVLEVLQFSANFSLPLGLVVNASSDKQEYVGSSSAQNIFKTLAKVW